MSQLFVRRAVIAIAGLTLTVLSLAFTAETSGQTSAAASTAASTAPAAPPVKPVVPTPELTPSLSGGMTVARTRESFSNLSLKDSDLKAEPPLFGEREVTADFVRELWQVRWRANDPIDLYVILPKGVKNPPVVLYLYGYPSETHRFQDDSYCKRVVQNGVAAVGFVSALTGHRDDYRPPAQSFLTELPEALATTTHDVQMILNDLETRHDLDMSHVGMFGQGSGAAIAVLAAATDPRIKAIDLLDPWGDWPDWLAQSQNVPQERRADLTNAAFLKRLEPLEPTRYFPELKSRKVRIQFVDERGDPKDAVHKLEAAAPAQAEVKHYPTGRAMYTVSSDGRLFEWLASELKAPSLKPVAKPVNGGMSASAAPLR